MLKRCFAEALLIMVISAVAMSLTAKSQNIYESIVIPGPLIEGHAKFEKNCKDCHEPFSRTSQPRLCLACHKEIAADRQRHRGVHGRQPDASTQECKHCHTDHIGRSADIVQFDRETFNHDFTDLQLKGAHKTTRCDSCHKVQEKFRLASGRCFHCHKSIDPHKGNLGELCNSCHNEEAWRRVESFDHNKTKYPLENAHKGVTCSACHGGERYTGLATTCVSCHRLQDVHSKRYGVKCESCHVAMKWKTIEFNHDKTTKFPLRDAHSKVKCDNCHTGDVYKEKLATSCMSCHKKDDVHKGQLSNRCEQCHNEANWRRKVVFDHDLSRFPLIGQHAVVPCEECHRSSVFKNTPKDCSVCHKDKHHEGRLGANCALCHNPNSWTRWRYDHDKRTQYPLTGAHQGLSCIACHTARNAVKITLLKDCFACHSRDDAHHGSFGRTCERCHTTSSFKQGFIRQ